MSNEDRSNERLRWLLNATPDELAAFDRLRTKQNEPERPASLKMYRMGFASSETGLSRTTLWRAIKDGRLRAVEVRKGSRRIPEAELRRFVEGR